MSIESQHRITEILRVTCYLSIDQPSDAMAASAVLDYLRGLGNHPYIRLVNFIQSSPTPAGYTGYWWSERRRGFVRYRVMICVADYEVMEASSHVTTVAELRQNILQLYQYHTGQPEQTCSVVAHVVLQHQ